MLTTLGGPAVIDRKARITELFFYRAATHQRMSVCDGLQHGWIRRREENSKEFNCIRSAISEAETTNNKRLRSTFCIEAIQYTDTKHRAASLRQQSFLFIIMVENRDFCPTCPRWNIAITFGMEKLGLSDSEKCWRFVYSFRHNTRRWRTVRDRRIDGQTPHKYKLHA